MFVQTCDVSERSKEGFAAVEYGASSMTGAFLAVVVASSGSAAAAASLGSAAAAALVWQTITILI